MVIWLIVGFVVILFSIGFVEGYTGKYRFTKNYIFPDDESEQDESEVHKQERIEILDNTLVQYSKLLDNLAAQLRNETDEKKRAAILRQQITTLEKYNRALEKREKLE